jgi:hypothetical protein
MIVNKCLKCGEEFFGVTTMSHIGECEGLIIEAPSIKTREMINEWKRILKKDNSPRHIRMQKKDYDKIVELHGVVSGVEKLKTPQDNEIINENKSDS